MIHEGIIWKCATPWISKHVRYQKSCTEILQATCSIIKTSRNNLQSCASVNHLDPIWFPVECFASSIFKLQICLALEISCKNLRSGHADLILDPLAKLVPSWHYDYWAVLHVKQVVFADHQKSKLFAGEIMVCPVLFAPLKAVEVRSSVVLLPCVLGSMAYLPQYSHREPSIKLGFWKGRRQSLEAKPQLIKSENHVAACDPLETSTRCWQREEFVRMEVTWTFLDPYRVLYITIASFVFDWSFKQNVCFLKNSLLLILLWFWFIFLSQMLHRWSCQSRRLGVSLCSEWPIFCTCLHNVSTKTRS